MALTATDNNFLNSSKSIRDQMENMRITCNDMMQSLFSKIYFSEYFLFRFMHKNRPIEYKYSHKYTLLSPLRAELNLPEQAAKFFRNSRFRKITIVISIFYVE